MHYRILPLPVDPLTPVERMAQLTSSLAETAPAELGMRDMQVLAYGYQRDSKSVRASPKSHDTADDLNPE